MQLDTVLQRIQRAGLKATPQRRAVILALAHATRPLSAQEVLDIVRHDHPRISLDTVYRTLTLLIDVAVVNQIHLQNKEVALFEFQGEGDHHHHAVCLACGRWFCIPNCPLPPLTPPTEDPDFRIAGHAFEIYGHCSRCQAAEREAARNA